MTTTHDWHRNKEMWIRVLEKQTGEGLEAWNAKMRKHRFRDMRLQIAVADVAEVDAQLRGWLKRAYAQNV